MRDPLDELSDEYEKHLPRIVREHGHGWVVFAGDDDVSRFDAFPAAARYARQKYGIRQVLIRHTDERVEESAPFLHVHAG